MLKNSFKILFVFVVFSLFIIGCRTVEKSIEYYNDCRNDTECMELMQNNKNISVSVVRSAVGTTTANGALAETVGCLAGSLASFLTGIYAGRKMKKRG